MRALADGAFASAQDPVPLQRAGHVSDLGSLLGGIAKALPRPSVMFVEGTTIAPEVMALLEECSTDPGRDDLWGTVWPRSDGFHIPVTDENVRALAALAERHATPELCDHVTVYSGDRILLLAHDVGSDVWLSSDLAPGVVERFRESSYAR